MKPFHAKSTVEPLAAHLREEILSGGLGGGMPGVKQLVRRLGVGTQTVVAALEVLKQEGLFRHTPPSALLPGEPALFFAKQQYLLGRELVVPRDVSLISLDDHHAFLTRLFRIPRRADSPTENAR